MTRKHVQSIVAAEEKMHTDLRETIDHKFEERKDILATMADIHALTLATKADSHELGQRMSALEVRFEQSLNKQLIWIIGAIFAASGLIVTLTKLL